MGAPLEGVLVVDKPGGLTSAAVVAAVKRALGGVKVGHTGTLDPMATGVLPVCLGEATKLSSVLTADDKTYAGELELGADTDTLDALGRIVRERRAEARGVDRAALVLAMAALVGDQAQIPPMYSAIKQGGRRLHELARAGAEVERAARPIHVERFELEALELPRARFVVACSKGTYVRSLVADLGERLGCGAHLTALRRTRAGRFTLERALPLAAIDVTCAAERLIGLREATDHLPSAALSGPAGLAASQGKMLFWKDLSAAPAPTGQARLLTSSGKLLALVHVEDGRVLYDRVMQIALT